MKKNFVKQPRMPRGMFEKTFKEAIAPFRNKARLDEYHSGKQEIKVKVGDKFKNKNPAIKKLFVITRVIPNGMVVGTYNPQSVEEVEEYLLTEELEIQFIKVT